MQYIATLFVSLTLTLIYSERGQGEQKDKKTLPQFPDAYEEVVREIVLNEGLSKDLYAQLRKGACLETENMTFYAKKIKGRHLLSVFVLRKLEERKYENFAYAPSAGIGVFQAGDVKPFVSITLGDLQIVSLEQKWSVLIKKEHTWTFDLRSIKVRQPTMEEHVLIQRIEKVHAAEKEKEKSE